MIFWQFVVLVFFFLKNSSWVRATTTKETGVGWFVFRTDVRGKPWRSIPNFSWKRGAQIATQAVVDRREERQALSKKNAQR